MEMTRWGTGPLKEETGVGTVDVAIRMADNGVNPYRTSRESWAVPKPLLLKPAKLLDRRSRFLG
ncbi:MAG: hypothetical protein OXN84_12535 [Albidovulum sp.]|nr:hypothetical protein [Albidovulum sp.]